MRPLSRLPWIALPAALALLVGCQKARSPESYVPADAACVISIPKVEQLLVVSRALAERFADLPAAKEGIAEGRAKLIQNLQLDIDKPESLRARGIDIQQGLYVFINATPDRGCLLVGESDRAAADKLVRELLTKASSKPGDRRVSFREAKARGLTVTEAIDEGDTEAELAWIHNRKGLILCLGESKKGVKVADYTAEIAQSSPDGGIFGKPAFQAARGTVQPSLVWAYFDGAAARSWLKQGKDKMDADVMALLENYQAVSMALQGSAQELAMRLFLSSTPARASLERSVISGKGPAATFGPILPGGEPLVLLKGNVNLDALLDRAGKSEKVGEEKLKAEISELDGMLGMDFRKDVLGLLTGRFLLGFDELSFGPEILTSAGDPLSLVPRLPLYLAFQITDRKKTSALLQKAQGLLKSLNMPVGVSAAAEPVYTVAMGERPMVSVGLTGDLLLVSTAEYFPKLIERAATAKPGELGGPEVTAALRSPNDMVMYQNMAQWTALMRLAMLFKPDAEAQKVMPAMEKFRDSALLAKWRDDGVLFDLQLRLR